MGSMQTAILLGSGNNMRKEHETGLTNNCLRRVAELARQCDSDAWARLILFDTYAYQSQGVNLGVPSTYQLGSGLRYEDGANLLAAVYAALSQKTPDEQLLMMAITDCHGIQNLGAIKGVMDMTPEAFLLVVHTSCDNSGLATVKQLSRLASNIATMNYTDGLGRNVGENVLGIALPLIQQWRTLAT